MEYSMFSNSQSLHNAFNFAMVVVIIAVTGHCHCAAKSPHKSPHILLVVADDYGWNDIGYHDSEIKTPTLDRLASEGVKLENYYVQPICTPSRSQLLSGRYQIHTGLQHGIIRPLQPNCLPVNLPTLPGLLRDQLNYSTHIVGKWHLGFFRKECLPTSRGFDSFYGYLTGSEDYFEHTRCVAHQCWLDLHDDLSPVRDMNGSYSTQIFTDQVIKLVDRHAASQSQQPLFIYLPYQAVHAPLDVPKKYTAPYQFIKNKHRQTYAGMVSAMDEGIKNITNALKRNNMWQDTLMVFTTDNGGQVHNGGNNYPLLGWKGSLWEGGVRGVGFVHGWGINETNATSKELIHISDWFPTLMHAVGGNVSGLPLDGHNVWDTISIGSASPRSEVLHNIDPLAHPRGSARPGHRFDSRIRAAIRYKDWKLLTGDPGVNKAEHVQPPANNEQDLFWAEHACMLQQMEKDSSNCPGYNYHDSTRIDKNKNIWLYNIKLDPNEYNDVSDKYPTIVNKLLDKLEFYNSTAVPCNFPKEDKMGNPKYHGGVWGPWK